VMRAGDETHAGIFGVRIVDRWSPDETANHVATW